MRKSLTAALGVWSALGAIVAFVGPGAAADTHVIKATPLITWTSNGQSSKTDGTPLVVDDLKVDDIIDIQIAPGVPHGLMTIKQIANVQPPADNEIKDPVLACGEDKSTKPYAVLQEVECGAASKFGIKFTGSMKLQVLGTFKDEVNFWCIIHHFGMTGKLKLKQ